MRVLIPNYEREGKGVDRNAPPKTGIALFIDILMREFTTLLKLNILFIISCIPIVTIGPAVGAMTTVTMKMVKDEPSDIYYDFKQGFKKNWKQSFCLGIIGGCLVLTIMCAFLYYLQLTGISYYLMMVIIALVSVVIGMMWIYTYPMAVSVNLNLKQVIKNSFILSIMYIKNSFITLVICGLIILLSIMFIPMSILLIFVLSFSMCSFVSSFCSCESIKKNIIK